jgi:glycerol kinase
VILKDTGQVFLRERNVMAADTILAIDNGTQSVRALLFDLEGTLLAKS